MPKFSLRELMWCFALVAAGVISFAVVRVPIQSTEEYVVRLLLFWIASPLIGAGISWLWPFRPRWVGLLFGGFMGFVVFWLFCLVGHALFGHPS